MQAVHLFRHENTSRIYQLHLVSHEDMFSYSLKLHAVSRNSFWSICWDRGSNLKTSDLNSDQTSFGLNQWLGQKIWECYSHLIDHYLKTTFCEMSFYLRILLYFNYEIHKWWCICFPRLWPLTTFISMLAFVHLISIIYTIWLTNIIVDQ